MAILTFPRVSTNLAYIVLGANEIEIDERFDIDYYHSVLSYQVVRIRSDDQEQLSTAQTQYRDSRQCTP